MQQTTVSLVFLDSYGCGPAPRIHLGTEHPGLRSIPFAVDSVKQEFGRGNELLDFAMRLESASARPRSSETLVFETRGKRIVLHKLGRIRSIWLMVEEENCLGQGEDEPSPAMRLMPEHADTNI
jgi:hypothetical protein